MTATPMTRFTDARAYAEQQRTLQQRRAVRTVADNARDRTEFAALLAMLGLEDPAPQAVPLGRRLADYVRGVAAAVGVSPEAVGHEVTDTATAYIPLDQRCATQPDHDLMLVWDERLGWYVAVETNPAEAPAVLSYLTGDAVPAPAEVARFVADTTAGRHHCRIRPVLPPVERTVLAERMARWTTG